MYERLRAAGVGALAGIVSYVSWLTFDHRRLGDPTSWTLSGPLKWFVIGGFLVGLLGGLDLAAWWLDWERDDVALNTVFNVLFIAFIVAMFAIAVTAYLA